MKRLGVVALAALTGFALAIVHFSTAETAQTCLGAYPTDRTYAAHFEGPVTMGETNHVLVVTHNGQPVSGGHVCLDTWMVGMSGMAMTQNANRQAAGRYQVPFQFAMGGPWQANIVVTRPDGTQVAVPIAFDVGLGGVNMPGMTMAP